MDKVGVQEVNQETLLSKRLMIRISNKRLDFMRLTHRMTLKNQLNLKIHSSKNK